MTPESCGGETSTSAYGNLKAALAAPRRTGYAELPTYPIGPCYPAYMKSASEKIIPNLLPLHIWKGMKS